MDRHDRSIAPSLYLSPLGDRGFREPCSLPELVRWWLTDHRQSQRGDLLLQVSSYFSLRILPFGLQHRHGPALGGGKEYRY